MADTGGLLRALARRPDGRAAGLEYEDAFRGRSDAAAEVHCRSRAGEDRGEREEEGQRGTFLREADGPITIDGLGHRLRQRLRLGLDEFVVLRRRSGRETHGVFGVVNALPEP